MLRQATHARKFFEQPVDAGRGVLKGAQAENLVTHPTTGNCNCQLVLRNVDPDMDRRLFFRHAFLHRKSTALAAMRSGYRLNHDARAAGKRHAVIHSNHHILHLAVPSALWLLTPRLWHIAMPSGEG